MDKQTRISVIKAMMDGVPVGNHEWNTLATELYNLEKQPKEDPYASHGNIGLAWTALIQQHYDITLDTPLPPSLVAQMMVAFKVQRAARVFHADNYVDLSAYARFAEEFQQKDVKQ